MDGTQSPDRETHLGLKVEASVPSRKKERRQRSRIDLAHSEEGREE